MTEKYIFYKLLLLNISDISLFFIEKLQPPEKVAPLFPSHPSLKIEILSNLPLFLKIWSEAQPPPAERGGRCTLWIIQVVFSAVHYAHDYFCNYAVDSSSQWRHSSIFIINVEHISHLVLVFLFLTLSR